MFKCQMAERWLKERSKRIKKEMVKRKNKLVWLKETKNKRLTVRW